MIDTVGMQWQAKTAQAEALRFRRAWAVWIIFMAAVAGLFGWMLMGSGSITSSVRGTNPAVVAWLVYLSGVVAILYKPRYGVYLIVFLTLLGDSILLPWWPFAKNFSSGESLLFLNNALIVSPLESYIGLTFLSWLGRGGMRRKLPFFSGVLTWPALAFTAFIAFGLAFGMGTGGNLNIGLWEARPIFYLFLMLVLVSNLMEQRQHISNLFWLAMIALLIEGITGNWYFLAVLQMDMGKAEAITEHAAAIHMNTLFVFIFACWLFRAAAAKRYILPLFIPFVGLTYLATQRRAAFLSLAIALALMGAVLFKQNRRIFWMIAPPLAAIFLVYTLAFWNSSGAIGLPARAIKSVLVTDTSSAEYSSNIYRVIENINTDFTIHAVPLTGVGFGKQFFIIAPMPDISFFAWWQYITHNSMLWMWMQTGVGGFATMVFLIGISIVAGWRCVWRMPGGDVSAAALTATLYLVMHFLYGYADMSWDNRSMVYVGVMMGVINRLEWIVAHTSTAAISLRLSQATSRSERREWALPGKRWHWQPDPPAVPGLVAAPGAGDDGP